MSYFRELPNIEYQSFLSDAISSNDYLVVKNLFRRNKIRDDLSGVFTLLNKYEIEEGDRPDTVAEDLYGSSDLDWVVLLTAGIINVRDEWPLSNYHLYNYAEKKYGVNLNDVHHYETIEIKDSNNKLILPKGKVVDEDFILKYSDNGENISLGGSNVRKGISNFEYETIKNNEKSLIYVLRKEYLQQFLNDMRRIMIYNRSSQYVEEKLIRTENTKSTIL